MSFRCDFCHFPQATGVSPVQVTTKIREKSRGTDIVEEKKACPNCSDQPEPKVIELARSSEDLPAFNEIADEQSYAVN